MPFRLSEVARRGNSWATVNENIRKENRTARQFGTWLAPAILVAAGLLNLFDPWLNGEWVLEPGDSRWNMYLLEHRITCARLVRGADERNARDHARVALGGGLSRPGHARL
jgi:hypothetical protein